MKVKRLLGYKLSYYKEILGDFYEPLLRYEEIDVPDEILEKVVGLIPVEEKRGRKKKEDFQDLVVEGDGDKVNENNEIGG